MPKNKIVFFEVNASQKKYLKSKLSKTFDLEFFPNPLNKENLSQIKDVNILGIFINSKITGSYLNLLPNLKQIVTLSTGYDHIDLEATKKRGIVVCNVPHYGENTVAEHTFALILSLSRKIIESNKRVKRGIFSPKGLTGFDLKGKTLGVIGCGNIGKNVIKIGSGFSMNILVFDLCPDSFLQDTYNIKYVDLDTLLKRSDIITLHVPYNSHTHHLLNRDSFKKMKKGVIVINTARGGLIETDALYDALLDKKVSYAGLDVLEEEKALSEEAELLYKDTEAKNNLSTLLRDHALIQHPNVLVTPHNAFNSREAIRRILNTTIENIVFFVKGTPKNTLY